MHLCMHICAGLALVVHQRSLQGQGSGLGSGQGSGFGSGSGSGFGSRSESELKSKLKSELGLAPIVGQADQLLAAQSPARHRVALVLRLCAANSAA